MASMILGTSSPFESGGSVEETDRKTATVVVEGEYEVLEGKYASEYCPSGYYVDSSLLTATGDGMGKLSVKCVEVETGSFGAKRTTFRIEMVECQYDLEDHPYLKTEHGTIMKWLGTDPGRRISDSGGYQLVDEDGAAKKITSNDNPLATMFCNAYMNGIKSFVRYFPVIEKISVYSNPPGMTRSDRSFTGGTPEFSSSIGHYDSPPLTLSGYPSTNWFKSKDSWEEQGDKTWRRTEQWTYTPESSSSNHAWVYNQL